MQAIASSSAVVPARQFKGAKKSFAVKRVRANREPLFQFSYRLERWWDSGGDGDGDGDGAGTGKQRRIMEGEGRMGGCGLGDG